jgi:hypothetical protein
MNEQLRVATAHAGPVMSQSGRAAMGVFAVIAALVSALLFVALILMVFSLVTTHTLFGWTLPYGIPMWLGVVALLMVYGALSAPLKMFRHGGPQANGYHFGWSALHGVMWVGFAALLIWVAYTFVPGVSEVLDQLMWAANLTVTTFTETIV